MRKSRLSIAAKLALSGVLAGRVAQAGNADLPGSIVIGTPVYTGPIPVVKPLPVYRPGARVWAPPAQLHARWVDPRVTRWDRDGDGIPNRHDRHYNPRWDRDDVGIPNRHDRHPGRTGWGR
jgi:hypothetical protein